MGTIEKALKKRQQRSAQTGEGNQTASVGKNKYTAQINHNVLNNEKINMLDKEIVDSLAGHQADLAVDMMPTERSQKVEIDIERLKSLGFMTSLESHTLLNEEFREIKRPLLQNVKGKAAHTIEKANLIQVTSSLQGEGKTFTAINLAIAIAMEVDHTVLLVDADVIKSSVSKTLGIQSETGLTDYLKGDVSRLSDVMLKTSIPKLSVLPAGSRQELSTELLNSDFMDTLFDELSGRYKNRVVIIDSPPLLETNESRVIAHKVGQIIFVVEHNKTTQASIKSALSLLEPEMVIGLVMNKNRSGTKSQYGYASDVE